MTETKYLWTPGPWTTEADPDNESLLVNSMRGIVCGISLWEDDGPEAQARKKADARLIAAAPEMAEALARVLLGAYATWMAARAGFEGAKTSHDLFEKKPDVIAARAALAKARGEP